MGQFDEQVAVGFEVQSAEGVFGTLLDVIVAQGTWDGTSGANDEGLLRGDPSAGIIESGLDLSLERESTPANVLSGSRTRPISIRQRKGASSFTFAFLIGGNKTTVAGSPPPATEFVPIVAIDAILQGVGMAAAVVGDRQRYTHSVTNQPFISALIIQGGTEQRMLDCLVNSLAVSFTNGVAVSAVVDLAVGTVVDPTEAAFPTLTFGEQQSVVSPIVENTAFSWNAISQGFSNMVLTMTNANDEFDDSNATGGKVGNTTDLVTTLAGTIIADDAGSNELFTHGQLDSNAVADLKSLDFVIGGGVTLDTEVADGMQLTGGQPVLDTLVATPIGPTAAYAVEWTLSNDTVSQQLLWDFF